LIEMWSHQLLPELASILPIFTSQVARIVGMNHCISKF
jgi:hypothetical protein